MKKIFKVVKRLFVLAFVILFLIYSVTTVVKQHMILQQVKAQQYETIKQIEKLKKENEYLRRLAQYVQTKEYIQQVAREKLGLVGKDEIVFIDKNKKRKQ
ncbi:Septum formation initiator [Caldicellulosiruptor saccharolyticus DSM 8903]|uniref:Septum formation initiator n=1 Tax=Caldicellulosiruptor saccharolyticus (strain ATCC 43494 / DSM 8903 / Tp8T 6331) TaxID=351627 RepID=A4XIT6_CALS8|nr:MULTISPECIES: septum formation initiator family protein [Caldicellulosiruptor]ABP66821.1 Septum formation initiator [Caldicellulosiruptor saccharolyticus DSM 8903]